jgi:hypothetical protein
MNVYKRTLVYIVIFICVFFFSCEKKVASVTDAVPEVPAGTPVITEHPKSAIYLEDEEMEELTIKASVGEGYSLSYQWYVMVYEYTANGLNRDRTGQLSIEFNKLINNDPEGSSFRKRDGWTERSCKTISWGRAVYTCMVTGTSWDGSETFFAVSDPAVIAVIDHPLKDWYTADKSTFRYSNYYARDTNNTRFADLRDITYGNGYFVAVGDLNRGSGPLGIIAYSNDGRTWDDIITDSPFGKEGISISSVAYGNGRFIAVGTGGRIAYSTDIKTWIPVESIVSENFADIVYGNGLFIASFGSGLVYSRDGETWASVEGFDASRISCIAYDNGRFIAGTYDGKISFSDNGQTWTTIRDNTFDSHEIVTVAYGNGRYLAFARQYNDWDPSSYKMGYSNDGKTWTTFYPSFNDDEWNWIKEIIYYEGYFVAVGYNKTAYSKDGISWNNLGEISSNYYRENYNSVTYGGGYFIAASDNGIINYCQWPITKAVAPVIVEHSDGWFDGVVTFGLLGLKDQKYNRIAEFNVRFVSFGERSAQWYRSDTDSTVAGVAIEKADGWNCIIDGSKAGTTYYYLKVTSTIPDYFNVEAKNREVSVTSNTVAVTIDIPEETAVQELVK